MNISCEEMKLSEENSVSISEEKILESIKCATEKATQSIISTCLKNLEQFQKEQMELQIKSINENKEFERQKYAEEKEFKKEQKKRQRKALIIEIWGKVLGSILAVSGFYLYFYTDMHAKKAEREMTYKQHQVEMIQKDIEEKKKMLQEGSVAISNLRTVSHKIFLHCQYGNPYSIEKQKEMRWDAEQKIIDTLRLSGYVFNDAVFQAATKIVAFSYSINDLCAFKGFDNQIRQDQGKLYDLQTQALVEDKQKISEIK